MFIVLKSYCENISAKREVWQILDRVG